MRVTFAKPAQGSGDPVAMAAAMGKPNEPMRKALSLGLGKLAFQAQKERFTGKGPFPASEHRLGVVTGRLRRDIHAEAVEITATGYRGRIGASVEYFGAHEVGFEGTVQVPAHTRQGYTVDRRARTATSKGGKNFSVRANQYSVLPQSVRAHSKKMKIAARAPLATAINQHGEAFLSEAIAAGVKQLSGGDLP